MTIRSPEPRIASPASITPPARPRRRISPLRARVAIVVLAVTLLAILVALAWRAASGGMEFPPAHVPWSLSSYPALARSAQPMTIHSQTGVTLVGRFFPGRSRATVVLSHGYGGDQDEMLPTAARLHAAGFTVVTYDERGRGASGGQGTWGALETRDLRSVIDAVARHPGVDPHRIGELGFSIGADISILEAADDPRIKVVVAAGSWPSLQSYMKNSLWDVVRHPTWFFSPLAVELMQLRTGADLGAVRPGAVIARISPRPIMLIDGTHDTDVTPAGSIANFHLARAPKTLWLVPGETHEGMVYPGGATTTTRVADFLAQTLMPGRPGSRSPRGHR
jgi:uncharacterized protein